MIVINTSSRYKCDKQIITKYAAKIAANLGINGIIEVSMVGKQKMKQVSSIYKHEQEPLPVLTFKYNEERSGEFYVGEILVCYPLAILLAVQRNKKVDDLLCILVEHGIKNFLLS